MEIPEIKSIIDAFHAASKSREETITIISALPVNGEASEVFEYCELVYKGTVIPNDYNRTDAGNAEYFTSQHGAILRFDHQRGRWLEWDRHSWRHDSDGQITRLALKSVRDRYLNAVNIEDSDARKVTAKWAIGSEQRARIEAAIALAKNMKPIADSGESWDTDPWLFCVNNGVVDLRTGELRPGKQEDRITMRSPADYNPDAKTPRWMAFLNEIFDTNQELIYWLQKYCGYCLTGDTREQVIPIGYGSGANGKTRLLSALRHVLGKYAYDAPFSTFELSTRSNIPNDLAALVGRRFVTSSETNEGTRLNEARIKSLTGQDTVTARFLHAEFFTFQPVAKFFLAVNHRPRVYDDSYGFWRRVRLIPFTRQFKGQADDKELLGKLIAETDGILAWLIEGCLLWQKEGLEPIPESIVAATQEYEADSDPLSDFILDDCVITPQGYVQSNRLYKDYLEWCENQGMREKEKMTSTAFGRRMGQKFKKMHKESGAVYVNLALKADGLLTGFELEGKNNEFIPIALSHEEINGKTGHNPSVEAKKADNPSGIEMPPYPEKPCPKCGSEWVMSSDGSHYICEKGHRKKEMNVV